uniref:NADH-ubiquinone oxidoreductase chain 3 n=1 Tax=Cercaria capricornia TaxID=1542953 RepID=A0A2I6K2C7_9TREM|nr:NADH dehydrogenase subunit 3 [Cercaria capricornia]AUL93147.1 NADH dehydrogenase subunit 3 [Cercaria capricornia]AUL93148.1 NADH dehydrogenase subunit 3 [Cercaria capricornia]AUL93149.1 NADH dehydrogenase subunit 3 [Cercaria capricornia]AUL93150.1 NADH dehydrogenase subunit 3 [Cercaria capricornia]
MFLVFSCVVLFFIIFLLVFVFHLYFWNSDWFSLPGLRSWVSSFECGFVSQRLVENYFSYTYFILLVFFVVFDLEVSLLLNMPLQGVLFKNLSYYLFFLFLLSVGFSVEVSKGYVEWGY